MSSVSRPDLAAYPAACHCGAIGYVFHTALAPRDWPVRRCGCGFCRAHGALYAADPAGVVDFHLRRAQALRRYRFGHGSADFLLCTDCGVYLGAVSDGQPALAVLNLNALQALPPDLPPPGTMDYEAETPAQRLERRARRWTPVRAGLAPLA